MYIYLFPFASIEKNAKVIIYGAGEVGRHYILQAANSDCCEFLFAVDRRYSDIKIPGQRVLPVEAIFEAKDFDYVIIAINSKQEGGLIKEYLLKNGVPESKVIFEKPKFYIINSTINGGQYWGSTTYAQHADDLMILNIFMLMGLDKPTYLDLGAHHPYSMSNTALLYLRGCRGINVEANPDLIEQFMKERPEDINICAGVGAVDGVLPFYVSDNIGLSSFCRDVIASRNPPASIDKVINVQVMTLEYIVNHYADGKFPDFLSIDVENMDYDILKSYDFKVSCPRVIDVEVHFRGADDYVGDKMKELLVGQGYFLYCIMGANYIFVKEEYRDCLY